MIREGLAEAWTRDGQHRDVLVGLEESVRQNRAGCLWRDLPGAADGYDDAGPLYAPVDPDRDCGDFRAQGEDQAFYEAAAGPTNDPDRLDGDEDGIARESLPGAPVR